MRVPADHLLGDGTGMGFVQLMQQLPQERLVIAIQAIAAIEAALEHTLAYVKQRKAFGKAIIDFQNTRFKLAELKTKALVARVFVDDCVAKHLKGELDVATAAMAKYYTTDLQCALIAKRYSPYLAHYYANIQGRRGTGKAIIAFGPQVSRHPGTRRG